MLFVMAVRGYEKALNAFSEFFAIVSPEASRLRGWHMAESEFTLITSFDELLDRMTWYELQVFLREARAFVWLTNQVFVCDSTTYFFSRNEDEYEEAARIGKLSICSTTTSTELTAVIDLLVNLLVTSHVRSVRIWCRTLLGARVSMSNGAIVQLASLKSLDLSGCELNEEQSRSLAGSSAITTLRLDSCILSNRMREFAHALERNNALKYLDIVDSRVDLSLLGQAISVNKSIQSFHYRNYTTDVNGWRSLLQGISQNEGLLTLDLSHNKLSDDAWDALCLCLAKHATLECLFLGEHNDDDDDDHHEEAESSETVTQRARQRTRALGAVLKSNTTMTEIWMRECDEELYQELIIPGLELNRCRPIVQTIQEAHGLDREWKFMEALPKVVDSADKLHLLFYENVDLLCDFLSDRET